MLLSSRLVAIRFSQKSSTSACMFSSGKQCCARYRQSGRHIRKIKTPFVSEVSDSDPGIGRRLNIIKEDQPDIRDLSVDEDNIEDMEADLLNAREMNKYHLREEERSRFKTRLKITERKFFKHPAEPNMLSWSEKEQIRHLHLKDSIEWNVEKLAESFPATKDIIKGVLKASWTPNDVARAKKHDETVARNWEAWKAGTLQVYSEELREHLKKFTGRKLLPSMSTDYPKFAQKSLPRPKQNEFSAIIESYKALTESDVTAVAVEAGDNKTLPSGVNDIHKKPHKLNPRIHKQIQPLDVLKERVSKSMAKASDVSDEDRAFVKSYVTSNKPDTPKRIVETSAAVMATKDFADIRPATNRDVSSPQLGVQESPGKRGGFVPYQCDENRSKTLTKYNKFNNQADVMATKDFADIRPATNRDVSSSQLGVQESPSKRGGFVPYQYDENRPKTLSKYNKFDNQADAMMTKDFADIRPVTNRDVTSSETGVQESPGKRGGFVPYQYDENRSKNLTKYNKFDNLADEAPKAVGDIPYRIHIPKSKVKRGYLYKVNDCFYSHDGFFLYKVPGMASE